MISIEPILGSSAFTEHPGELAAFATVGCWSVSALAFTEAAKRMGSLPLNIIRLAMALGGKAFVTMTGDVASVTSAVDAAAAICMERGLLVNKVVIPNPRKELLKEIV